MDQRLEELAQYILRIVPQAKAISNLQKDSKVGIVRFNWNSHQFVVKPSLEVIEIKGPIRNRRFDVIAGGAFDSREEQPSAHRDR